MRLIGVAAASATWRGDGACARMATRGTASTAAASSSRSARFRMRYTGASLSHVRLGLGALQMLVEIRRADDLTDVHVVHADEVLGALPLAFPVLRVGHR